MIKSNQRSLNAALRQARSDFRKNYDRGLIKFPDRESGHHAHYCNAERIARCCGVERAIEKAKSIRPQSHAWQRVQRKTDAGQAQHHAKSAVQGCLSFNEMLEELYVVQDAMHWIHSKERLEAIGRQSWQALSTRAQVDLSANPTEGGYEPLNLDVSTHLTPKHYEGVRKSKDREHWETAMEEELANCRKMGTWEFVPQHMLPPGANLVDCKWVYKIKSDRGVITRWRARIVARGFTQRPGVDYDEEGIYAPVVSYDTFRTCLSIAAANDSEIKQADIKNAYLIGHLSEPIYMRQPPSARMMRDSLGRPLICKLKRPLYGLKQSGHIFASALHGFLVEELGMKRLISDKCAFVKDNIEDETSHSGEASQQTGSTPASDSAGALRPSGGQLIVLTYVDDLTIIGTSSQVDWIMSKLRARFALQESETGELSSMLSMEVERNRKEKSLTIRQEAAIIKIASSLGIEDEKPSVRTAMVAAPLEKLSAIEDSEEARSFGYLNAVGSLLHIAQCTRPDISYAVGALARHSASYGTAHIRAVKRVAQYLYNTRKLCIKYQGIIDKLHEPEVHEAGRPPQNPLSSLVASTDADYAMDPSTRKSTSGGIIHLNNGPIIWSSRLQKITAQSTAESEIIAATEITKEVVHLDLLLAELGVRKHGPVTVQEDNQACILMGQNMKSSRAAKHFEVRLHFLQESIRSGVIKFKYCETNEMVADALTKPLEEPKFLYFRSKMLYDPGTSTT